MFACSIAQPVKGQHLSKGCDVINLCNTLITNSYIAGYYTNKDYVEINKSTECPIVYVFNCYIVLPIMNAAHLLQPNSPSCATNFVPTKLSTVVIIVRYFTDERNTFYSRVVFTS